MRLLEERIIREGRILEGDILKVDSFVNHQVDMQLMSQLAKELAARFASEPITKVLTIEASGIAFAGVVALELGVPMVFAKKHSHLYIDPDLLMAPVESFTTKNTYNAVVSRRYLSPDDVVLIVDDFLAAGRALSGLVDLCRQAGAKVAGAGIIIEKAYQHGGDSLRASGLRIESMARIASMDPAKGTIEFTN
ncbi:MAG: xanthine phosphoribosyltransferase [Coriobacteriales bacterium]|nr:xanthine phosphoribosyltransferase [Coriobacteriales bacterium]